MLVAESSIEIYVYKIQDRKRKKDETPRSAKTMELVRSIQEEVDFIEMAPYFVNSLCFGCQL